MFIEKVDYCGVCKINLDLFIWRLLRRKNHRHTMTMRPDYPGGKTTTSPQKPGGCRNER